MISCLIAMQFNSAVVDIYNASSNKWTTASLSQGRQGFVATTVGHYAIFAGGYNGSVSFNQNNPLI
jgi:hypothetical protein